MSTLRRRSHEGCWTCKARRRKCDNGRPTCQNCQNRGIVCEGYEVRLRWNTGVASRGRFTGAAIPIEQFVPPRPKGRRRDWEAKRSQKVTAEEAVTSTRPRSATDTSSYITGSSVSPNAWMHFNCHTANLTGASEHNFLFQRFLKSGINILHSTVANDADNILASLLPQLCEDSEALYAICVTFQASISKEYESQFFDYFDLALRKFRVELANSVEHLKDTTITAGLLLCSIGFMRGLPWTMHLQGLYNILQVNGFHDPVSKLSPFRAHLIEVLGLMDLPTFAIGRQNPYIGVWRRYCRVNDTCDYSGRSKVELISGVPRSLLDIFSTIGEGATEEEFWDWPGAEGSFLQCQLWEAYRLAGMLALRQGHLLTASSLSASSTESLSTITRTGGRPRTPVLPKTIVLVSRILSNVDAILRASVEPEHKEVLVTNALHYPVFIAGLEREILNTNSKWKGLILSCFNASTAKEHCSMEGQLLFELLEKFWGQDGDVMTIDELARVQGLELGLL